MRPLYLCSEAAELDRRTQTDAALPGLLLMEDASLSIWQRLRALLAERGMISAGSASGGRRLRIAALAGKGSNGGDALALIRQAAFAFGSSEGLCCILAAGMPAPYTGAASAGAAGDASPAQAGANAAASPQTIYAASLKALGVPLYIWEGDEGDGRGGGGAERNREALAAIAGADVIIDGLAGTGIKGPLRGKTAALRAALAQSIEAREKISDRALPLVCSIDIPSGLSDGMVPGSALVEADYTFSVEPRKLCLYTPAFRAAAGEIVGAEGVFPAAAGRCAEDQKAVLLEAADLESLMPRPSKDAHKGSRGRAGIYAGSPGMSGAARLAARAAAAASAGIVFLCVDPELVGSLSGGAAVVQEAGAPRGFDACLAGPGWREDQSCGLRPGNSGGALEACAAAREDGAGRGARLRELIDSGIPLVIDAGGLRVLAGFSNPPDMGGRAILTPHPGEFAALSGLSAGEVLSSPREALQREAARRNAFIVLKCQCSWICSPDGRIAVWDGRDPSLATAGSGDVLAGLCTGLLASYSASGRPVQNALWDAARAAVIAHGLAGRSAFRKYGWYEADRIAEEAALILSGEEHAHV